MKSYSFDKYSRAELRHALKRADPEIFADVIQFLEDDPWIMGAGYLKEIMWKYIRRYDLQPPLLERLEQIALNYFKRPISREHKLMWQTMSRIASPVFWLNVEACLDSDDHKIASNARYLFPYSKGFDNGEKYRSSHRYWAYKHRPPAFTLEELMALLGEETNWIGGRIVYAVTDDPYVHYNLYDELFTSIDWTFAISEVLLPRLATSLSKCHIEDLETLKTSAYIAYALGRIGQPSAVPMLIEFLKLKVDHKVEGPVKGIVKDVTLKALKQIGTPDALQAIIDRPDPYQ